MESGISEKEKTEVDDIMSEFPLPHDHGGSKNLTEIRHELTDAERFDSAAEVFSRLSDPMRVRLFWLLCHSEQCVINIAALLDMSSPAVSHHLRVLSDSRLIVSRRVGKEVYYRVADSELTDLLLPVVALDDAVGLVVFAISFGVAKALHNGTVDMISVLVDPLLEIVLSLVLGAALGAVLTFLEKQFL